MGVFNSLFKSKIQKLIEKAEKGDAISLYQLGMCYFDGTEVTQDYNKAIEWFRKAAEQEEVNSIYNLGVCYIEGKGVAQNLDEAIRLYQIIINNTHLYPINEIYNLAVETQYNLGICFLMKKDNTTALGHFINAAEKGHIDAQFNAGVIFYNERKDDKARYWLKKAAEQGDNTAKQLLQEF